MATYHLLVHILFYFFLLLQRFINQYKGFKGAVEDFDRRLATIICQGFDDCSGLESAFKVKITLLLPFFKYEMLS